MQMRMETKMVIEMIIEMVMVMVDYEIEEWIVNNTIIERGDKNTQFNISLYHILMRSVDGVQLSVTSGLFLCILGQI